MSHRALTLLYIPFTVCVTATVLLSLSACAHSPSAAPTSTASQAPSATPTFVATALYSGDCDKFLPIATVQSILGVSLPVNPEFTRPDFGVAGSGGIGCNWELGEQGDLAGGQLYVTVAPAIVGTSADISAAIAASPKCDTGPDLVTSNGGCRVSFVSGGWWVEASPYVFTSAAAQGEAATRLETAIRATLAGKIAPAVEQISSLSCAAVDASISPTAALGLGEFTQETGTDYHQPGSAGAAAVAFAGQTHCGWTTSDFGTNFDLTIFPKSTAVFLTCSHADSTVSSVPGVHQVVTFAPGPDGGAILCATDGTSTAMMGGPVSSQTVISPWTADQLAQASKILVPALAFASADS